MIVFVRINILLRFLIDFIENIHTNDIYICAIGPVIANNNFLINSNGTIEYCPLNDDDFTQIYKQS